MILSASRRTDIPAFYFDWFLGRVRAGFTMTRNPLNAKQVRRVSLLPDDVDGIVFWSKNPRPMLSRLDALSDYRYYIQYTLNAYPESLEPGLPPLNKRIDTLRRLSDQIGPSRIVWRYDPIFLSPDCDVTFHTRQFERIATEAKGAVKRVTISFLDLYRKITGRVARHALRAPTDARKLFIAGSLAESAKAHGIEIDTCCEPAILSIDGIGAARCIDPWLLTRPGELPLTSKKDPNQRPGCGCAASVDIGAYDCCTHGCVYCYANRGDAYALANRQRHDPHGEFLLG